MFFMAYCPKCGSEVLDEAEIYVHCGCRIKSPLFLATEDGSHAVRFILTFLFVVIGSFIINHKSLKPA